MTSGAQRNTVIEAIRQWQTRLLQLDRRNALLYFPTGKRGVTLVNVRPDELLERLASSRAGLRFLYAERARSTSRDLFEMPVEPAEEDQDEPQIRIEPGDLDTNLAPLELQKRLTALSKKEREWQEEQGLNVLFIALGFLRWIDADQEPACSPVLLAPCDLTRESPRDPYVLAREESDDLTVNRTLRHKLLSDAAIALPDHDEQSPDAYLSAVERLISGREGWALERTIVVGTFPFSKLAMWEDLDLMAKNGISHPLVCRLGGDAGGKIEQPTTGTTAIPREDSALRGARLDDLLEVRDQHTVVDADFSQLRAIELARSGANLVIHGPPGTGKSQTIANIIATLLAEGRRVLFVSEKTAALDVVKRRLSEVGLGALCLDLHSDRGKKASVYKQLREARDQPPANSSEFPFERLVARRSELNAIVRALHQPRLPLGLSAFQVHGRVAAIRDVPRINVVVRDVATLDDERLRRIEDAARRVARRATEFREHHTSRWRALGPVPRSPRLEDIVREDLTSIRAATETLVAASTDAARACGFGAAMTLDDADKVLQLADHLKGSPGPIPPEWLSSQRLDEALVCTRALRNEAAERARLLAIASTAITGQLPTTSSNEHLEVARAVAREAPSWEHLAGSGWSAVLLSDPHGTKDDWRAISAALSDALTASAQLQSLLGVVTSDDSREGADGAGRLAKRVLNVGVVPKPWTDIDAMGGVRSDVQHARAICDGLAQAETALQEHFDLSVVDRVDDEMLVRYRTDHRSLWRWLRPSYRHDHRTLRGCLRRAGRLSLDDATAAIERALVVRRLRESWSETEPRMRGLVGDRFLGRQTDWGRVEAELDAVGSLLREHGGHATNVCSLLTDVADLEALSKAARAWGERAARLDQLWPECDTRVQKESLGELSARALELAEAADRVATIIDSVGPFARRPVDLDELVSLLKTCAQLHGIEELAAAVAENRIRTIGAPYTGWATDFDWIELAIEWTRDALARVSGGPSPTLTEHLQRPRDAKFYESHELTVRNAATSLRSALDAAAPRFPENQSPWPSWALARLDSIRSWCEDLRVHAEEASDWLDYRAAAGELDHVIGNPAADAVRSTTDDGDLVPDVILRHVYLCWLENVYHSVRELQFAPKDIENTRREFWGLDSRLPRAAQERVRARCLAKYPSAGPGANGMGEFGTLNHQLSLKRPISVRKLVAKIPNVLQRMKPCFMMSPLAVSQFLPRGATDADTLTFDTVVFDEASQVFPEDAVPAVARGSQCIVVGDQQQLPPSSFFRKDIGDDDEADDEDEGETANRLSGVESILDVLVGMHGAGVDSVYLQVHYRSQHDDLIKYSNHYFYDDRLLTFPSAFGTRAGLGLRSIYLPDGRFDAGSTNTNRVEADRVVATVFELMESRPTSESIGVVALSRAQADLIQELIDVRRLSDRRFDDRFAEEAHERFFVKNLENVQGDERDHVILSIGYGPTTATGMVPNRFGPVNVEGGHRRLNVAVSRARRSMTVVHSLRPEDIRSETQGAKLLRRYLEFLRLGDASIEGAVTSSPGGEAESPFEDAVGRALESRGYRIRRQVGCAKYSIDVAVMSEDGNDFDLGIECDGDAYHRSPSARDRDRLRQEILERMGWRGRIHRVWSTAWIRNARAEIESIERAIQAARSRPRDEPRTVAPTPTNQPAPSVVRQAEQVAETSAPAREAEKPLLGEYVEADLRRFPRSRDLREESAARVAELVAAVVTAEGPVHLELVVERVRRHYRLQRAGRVVRDAVLAGAREALRRGSVAWLPLPGASGRRSEFLVTSIHRQFVARGVAPDGSARVIDQICDQEIDAAVIRLVGSMVGATRNETAIATARAFGYARTGALVEDRVREAIDRLVTDGQLGERMGSLVLPG